VRGFFGLYQRNIERFALGGEGWVDFAAFAARGNRLAEQIDRAGSITTGVVGGGADERLDR
jgi:hypothetical protein